ncbi:MAG: alpha-D-ribose 1-methylphosphonate 5-triphosphate diphosphatase [Pseudomonadota bacterium]
MSTGIKERRRAMRIELQNAGGLAPGPVWIEGDAIALGGSRQAENRIDLSGLALLPWASMIPGNGFERHLAPRRGAVADLGAGLRASEVELASNGITTAFLAQFWSWEGGMRGPDFARDLAAALANYDSALDLRLQLRVELCLHREFDAIADQVTTHAIPAVIFNDHLPHKALAEGRRVPRLEGQALKAGRAPQAHQALLEELYRDLPQARAALPAFAARLAAAGVILGSHDDPDAEARDRAREIGLGLAEFPLTLETARAACAAGDPVVLGAPNVLRGSSHKRGGMAAREAVEAGLVRALASDYHYPAPRLAAAKLVREGWSLRRAWALVSAGPAEVFGLSDRGQIAEGGRADLVVTSADLTQVHGTFAGGRLVYADAILSARMLA